MKRAWLLFSATSALAVVDFALTPGVLAAIGALILDAIAAVGAVVASRRPGNPSGWLLCVIALSFAASVAGDSLYDAEGLVAGAWLASWVWVPAMISVAAFPLVFPTGRPPTQRWRPLLWALAAAGPLLMFGTAFTRGELEDYPGVQNPFGLEFVETFGYAGFFVLLASIVGSIAALVVRFRRAVGAERQQLKWVTAAAAVFPLTLILPFQGDAGFVVLLVGVLIIALAVAVAILRYRLYDIDVVINRALVYGALTLALAGTYLATVLLAQLVLPARSDLGIALSTLAAAAVFAPARRRIQSAVDRRFFRRRYDAARTLEAFGARLRDEVDLDTLTADLRGVVAETMQPAHVSLWLRAAQT